MITYMKFGCAHRDKVRLAKWAQTMLNIYIHLTYSISPVESCIYLFHKDCPFH